MIHIFLEIVKRDIMLSLRGGSAGLMVVSFFIMVTALFPFAVGPDQMMLARLASGVIWVSALLSCLLSLDRIFQADYEEGVLDQFLLTPCPLEIITFAKAVAHFIVTGVPLIIISPFLAVMLNLPSEAYGMMLLSMAIGLPALSFIGAIGAALTVTLKRGGVLLSLLILPLYIPVLIFGVLSIQSVILGIGGYENLMLLGGVSLFTAAISPWASAAALKIGLE